MLDHVTSSGLAPPPGILEVAVDEARSSPCAKSKRGAVIWLPSGGQTLAWTGCNEPAIGECDGSEACRRDCGRICVHAEQTALLRLRVHRDSAARIENAELLHIKVVNGHPVAGGPPSCVECSKLLLAAGIAAVWLLEEGRGWVRRTSAEFHADTIRTLGLHRSAE
jgi:deoxycytidylate deaminase